MTALTVSPLMATASENTVIHDAIDAFSMPENTVIYAGGLTKGEQGAFFEVNDLQENQVFCKMNHVRPSTSYDCELVFTDYGAQSMRTLAEIECSAHGDGCSEGGPIVVSAKP